MKNIFIIGAGLSSSSLIKYLLDKSTEYDWNVRLGDVDLKLAERKIDNHSNGKAVKFDVFDETQRTKEIQGADVVISMLPAHMHIDVAKACIKNKKHMLTASYVSKEMKELDQEAKDAGVALYNELGVDPGIDHMSAMEVINRIKKDGGEITEFESNTGGLVAPKYDNNPWNYKFTWNPRNVVLAGQGGGQFLHNKKYKYIPYHKIFSRYERIHVLDLGEFEAYPNRDSLTYQETYGLQNVDTMFRGTIRRPGYCRAWDIFVQLGMTDDSYKVVNSENITNRDFINSFLHFSKKEPVEDKLAKYLGVDEDSTTMYRLRWLGMFEDEKVGLKNVSPAQILQHILEQKLNLDSDDIDMIVMQHQFTYKKKNVKKKIYSSMIAYGIDKTHTAMSITVGTPVAIATKLLLTGKLKLTGVHVPIHEEMYEPILKELEDFNIKFIEEEVDVDD